VGTRLGGWLIAAAAALIILGVSIAPFLAPPVVRFEQDRVNVGALTSLSPEGLDGVTGALLEDLVLWRGDFGEVLTDRSSDLIQRNETRQLTEAEAAHMRDVRVVFSGLWILVIASVVVVAAAFRRAKGTEARADAWRSVAAGARALAIVVAALGAFALLAFDTAFEVFHRLFFSPGSYTFDPATSILVRLFPDQFWSDIAIAVGLVAIVAAILTAWFAGRRAARVASTQPAPVLNATRAGA
jgi:integral membrane protein (TIGR01906 family)